MLDRSYPAGSDNWRPGWRASGRSQSTPPLAGRDIGEAQVHDATGGELEDLWKALADLSDTRQHIRADIGRQRGDWLYLPVTEHRRSAVPPERRSNEGTC